MAILKGNDRKRALSAAKAVAIELGSTGATFPCAVANAEAAIGGRLTRGERATLQEYFDDAVIRATRRAAKPPTAVTPITRAGAAKLSHVDAAAVQAAANRVAARGDGFAGHKSVFISDVAAELGIQLRDLDAFKDLLRPMGRAGLVRMSRADLVEAMDPGKVDMSEMFVLGGSSGPTWHFVNAR